ncbi:MAG: cation transporter [Leptospiraceae bacterium]|nr:cation transporter [Leptospiraceae bacterium]
METTLKKTEVFITGITCEGSARTLKKKFESIKGVKHVTFSLES